jgi:SPP1 gp7 family putative phage head morphogenesis protein
MSEKSYKSGILSGFQWTEEEKIFVNMMTPIMWEEILMGAEYARSLVGGSVHDSILQGRLRSFLKLKEPQLKDIHERIRRSVETEINTGITQGETLDQLSDRVRSTYNGFSTYRARTIARTETTGAINGGSLQYYKAVGARHKEWITANDDKCRDSHIRCQAQGEVDVDKPFINGLMMPGGETNDPAEVVNCRCRIITQDEL